MPRILIWPVLLAGLALIVLWATGGFDWLSAYAAGEQREFQKQIARTLRSLRSGEAGALGLLLMACFAYGFFHAVGPGHGKVLIGGYGLGRKVPMLRLSAISLLASLGQAVTAVTLVFAGVWLFSLTRSHIVGAADDIMAPLSNGAIALIGGWLIWRGSRRALSQNSDSHDHHHGHDHSCPDCGHRHGPTPDEVTSVSSLREALLLIGGIAIRPCTGALFVLIITLQMGIAPAGIAGAFAMALGTATVTIAVGLAATSMRGSLLSAVSESGVAARIVPIVEVSAGLLIFAIAGGLLLQSLA